MWLLAQNYSWSCVKLCAFNLHENRMRSICQKNTNLSHLLSKAIPLMTWSSTNETFPLDEFHSVLLDITFRVMLTQLPLVFIHVGQEGISEIRTCLDAYSTAYDIWVAWEVTCRGNLKWRSWSNIKYLRVGGFWLSLSWNWDWYWFRKHIFSSHSCQKQSNPTTELGTSRRSNIKEFSTQQSSSKFTKSFFVSSTRQRCIKIFVHIDVHCFVIQIHRTSRASSHSKQNSICVLLNFSLSPFLSSGMAKSVSIWHWIFHNFSLPFLLCLYACFLLGSEKSYSCTRAKPEFR